MAARGAPQAAAAALGLTLSLALFWPGIALFDSVEQLKVTVKFRDGGLAETKCLLLKALADRGQCSCWVELIR